jgi:competence protein ComEC
LSAEQPQYAVISVGVNNHFGHPHSLTLDRLKNLGTKVFRTDQVGDIIFFSNGQELLPVTAF